MNKKANPRALVDRLQAKGFVIEKVDIRSPVTADDREFASIIGSKPPPPAIDRLYDAFDGFTLIWNGTIEGSAAQGSINIIPYAQSVARAAADEKSQPLEGILWTADTPETEKEQLRNMAVFESVTGRSQFLTYRVGSKRAKLFLVERDEIQPLATDFDTTVGLLFQFGGVVGLRELLVFDDWQDRLRSDPLLKQLAQIF